MRKIQPHPLANIYKLLWHQICNYLIFPERFIIYLFKVNDRNTIRRCEICSKLTIKILDWHQWHRSGVFIVDFEHISHVFHFFIVSIVNFKQVNVSWESREESLAIFRTNNSNNLASFLSFFSPDIVSIVHITNLALTNLARPIYTSHPKELNENVTKYPLDVVLLSLLWTLNK